MNRYTCPGCRVSVPLREKEFPFFCHCGFIATAPADFETAGVPQLATPPLPTAEIARRVAICETCPMYQKETKGCRVCKTCGSGMAMYWGLLKDPKKRCPYPEPLGGDKWGPSPFPAPLRVAFLSPGLTCGGAERWILSLCQNFDPAKVWVQAIGIEGAKNIDQMMREQVPKHIRVVTEWDNIFPVAKAVDMLIVWGSPGMIELARQSGKPFVVVVHGADATSSYGGRIAKDGIAAGGLAACVNEACLACYPEEHRSQVAVIPNGADEERVKPSAGRDATRAELGIGDEQRVLLYLGRVMRDKDIAALTEALDVLPPEWICVMAGPGGKVDHPRVKRIDQRNHVGDLLAAVDVQILLSKSEAHPLSITEGWLAGVPTATSDLPWIQAIHRKHGTMSWTVDPKASPDQVAAKILEADAAGRGSEQVLHAQEVARLEFTARSMATRWEAYLASKS